MESNMVKQTSLETDWLLLSADVCVSRCLSDYNGISDEELKIDMYFQMIRKLSQEISDITEVVTSLINLKKEKSS